MAGSRKPKATGVRAGKSKPKAAGGEGATIAPEAPTPTSNGSGGMAPDEEMIRQRAYEVFVARGAGTGDALSDWLTAEREIKARLAVYH